MSDFQSTLRIKQPTTSATRAYLSSVAVQAKDRDLDVDRDIPGYLEFRIQNIESFPSFSNPDKVIGQLDDQELAALATSRVIYDNVIPIIIKPKSLVDFLHDTIWLRKREASV